MRRSQARSTGRSGFFSSGQAVYARSMACWTTSAGSSLCAQPRVEVDACKHLQIGAKRLQGLGRIGEHGLYLKEDDICKPTNHAAEKMPSMAIAERLR